ncbi:MAG: DUF4167 domain-containing protein [Caulobacter sp.]|nr:DUF4167 domain-containing protein [Caulobacter sp.]
MRDFKGMKRQRGRNRNAGGKPQQHNANRAYDSNGPEGIKVRGAAQSVFEKYQQLARDATTSGDRVLAENYLQHAEHYFRLIRAIQPTRSVSDIVGRDNYSSGMDIDFEAEHEEPAENPASDGDGASQQGEGGEGDERPRFDNNRQNRDRDQNRDDRQRFDNNRQNRDRDQNRDDRGQSDQGGRRDRWRDRDDRSRDQQGRDDRPRDDRPREDRQRDDRPRDDRSRDDSAREDGARDERSRDGRRGRFDRNRDRDDRGEARDPLAVIEPQAAPLAPEPKPESSPRLRGQDGAVSELPGFLSRGAEARDEAAAEAPAKPKRRRAPKSFEGAEAPAKTGSDEG